MNMYLLRRLGFLFALLCVTAGGRSPRGRAVQNHNAQDGASRRDDRRSFHGYLGRSLRRDGSCRR